MMVLTQETNSAAWSTLIAALGGVIVTSAAALITAYLNHRWQRQNTRDQQAREEKSELRQMKQVAYVNYVSAVQFFRQKVWVAAQSRSTSESTDRWAELVRQHQDFLSAHAAAVIISSRVVGDAIAATTGTMQDLYDSFREMMIKGTASPEAIRVADKTGPPMAALIDAIKADLT